MRKLFTLLVAVLLTASVFAQAPEKMSYQAVIRNSSDALVTNTSGPHGRVGHGLVTKEKL